MQDRHGEYKQWAFRFVPGVKNGAQTIFCQVWLKDAMFCTIEQGWFDYYAFRFKFVGWQDMPKDLAKALNETFICLFKPTKKNIG